MSLNFRWRHISRGPLVFTYLMLNVVLIRYVFIHFNSWYWSLLLVVPLVLVINKLFFNLRIMNNNVMNPTVLSESDLPILKRLASAQTAAGGQMSLAHEIERAIVVKDNAFPANTIRINSQVTIQNLETGRVSSFSLVLPEHADIQKKKISILAPMGAALIGFREGDITSWEMPGGLKRLKVLSVENTEIDQ